MMITGMFEEQEKRKTELKYIESAAMHKVKVEMMRQDGLWGRHRTMAPECWLPILMEEVGEVATEILTLMEDEGHNVAAEDRYIDELSQVAAVAIRMMESVALNRRDRK